MKKRIISALLVASMFCSSVLQELSPGFSQALAEGLVSEETSVQELIDGEEGFFHEFEAPAEEVESALKEDDALAKEEKSDSEEEKLLADEEKTVSEEEEEVVDGEENVPAEDEAVTDEEKSDAEEEEPLADEEETVSEEDEEVIDGEKNVPAEDEAVADEEESDAEEEEPLADEEETVPAAEEVAVDEEESVAAENENPVEPDDNEAGIADGTGDTGKGNDNSSESTSDTLQALFNSALRSMAGTLPAAEEVAAEEEESVDTEDENPVERDDIEVKLAADAGDTGKGNEDSSESTSGTLQALVDNALRSVTGTLKGKFEIILKKNTVYSGDVTIDAAGHDVADDFLLEMNAEDAGEDGLQANGQTQFTGFMSIQDLSVAIRGLSLTNAVSVQDAKLDYYGTIADDSVDITANSGAQVTIKTGEGADDVNVTAMNGGSVEIETGEGDDQVHAIVKDQGSAVIETSEGDDSVTLYQGEQAGNTQIETSAGDDSVNITKVGASGDVAVGTGAGDDTVVITSGGTSTVANGEIAVDLGSGDDQVMVDISAAQTTEKVDIEGGADNDRVHFTGSLDPNVNVTQRITGTADNLYMSGSGHTMNVTSSDVETMTDDLQNKRTVTLNGSILYDPFTNYVYDGPANEIKDIRVHTMNGAYLPLTSLVIDARVSGDKNYSMVIPEDAVIMAKNVQLVIQGRNVTVNGTLKGDLVRINAFDSTTAYAPIFNFFGYEVPIDLLSISDQAHVTIGKNARIYSETDIIVEASVDQDGGIITLAPDVNIINLKLAKASIDVSGKLYAGYDLAEETPNGERGSVRMAATTRTTAGFEEDGSVSNGLPLAVTLANADAAVTVQNGAVIEASDSIKIKSKTDLKIASKADTLGWLPVSIAVNVLTSDAKSIVDGALTAGKDVSLSASATMDARTIADSGRRQTALSGGYLGVGIVLQHAKAELSDHAVVNAGGDVSVKSYAWENAETKAITGNANRETEKYDAITESVNTLTSLWTKITDFFTSDEQAAKQRLQEAIGRISVSDHSVRVDEISKSKASDLRVNSATVKNGSTEIRVQVSPLDGYAVKAVTWRGLNPGDTAYTIGSARQDKGAWVFTQQVKDVTVFVEYEEVASELNEEEEPESEPDLFGEDQEDQSINVREMVETFQDSIADLPDQEEYAALPANISLTLSGVGGSVLTYATDPQNPTQSLKKVAAGQAVRLVVNPEEGKLLKTGSLKATYMVTEDNREVTRTIIISPDEQYNYILKVPENIVESEGIAVRAEFADDSVEDRDPGHRGMQLAGAIAVNVTENHSQAMISTGAQVTAGGDVNVVSNAVTHNSALADGSAINGKKPTQEEDTPDPYAIVRNDRPVVTEETIEISDATGYTFSLRTEGVRTAENAVSGTIRVISTYASWDGTIIVIEAKPAAGFKLDGDPVWIVTQPNGRIYTYTMDKTSGDQWNRATERIPEGSHIEIVATFVSDDHAFMTQNDPHGQIILHDDYARTGECPVVTVQSDPDYTVEKISAIYQTPSGEMIVEYSREDLNGDSIVLDIPQLTKDSYIDISAEFKKKDITIAPGFELFADEETPGEEHGLMDVCVVSEELGAAGETVKVSPDESSSAEGYTVRHVFVVDANNQVIWDQDGDSFVIPEGMTDTELTVIPTLGLKEVELKVTELDHGDLKPMTTRADRGETVDVHIDADSGYRMQQGSLKAILTTKDGTYREEIYMSRWSDFLYTFVMPQYAGDASELEITFEGKFEKGQAGEGTGINFGAGLAVNVAKSRNRADIMGTVQAGGDITAQAYAEDSASTESAAGYSTGTMGIGGALTIQSGSFDSKARIHATANLSLDGALSLDAQQAVNFKVDADASGSKRQAQGMGVGAGLALAFDKAKAIATVHKDAVIRSLTNEDGIGGLTLRADQTVTDSVTAAAGAAGGDMTLMGAVAYDSINTSATATLPEFQKSMFHVRNGASITASNLATHVVEASGATVGNGTAVGAAIGASIVQDTATATLGQKLTAQRLTVSAVTESNVRNVVTATASAGRMPFRLRFKDSIPAMVAIGALKLMAISGNYPFTKEDLNFILKYRLRVLTTSGTIGITAAAGYNNQKSHSIAEVLDGVDVDVAGRMAVRAENHTEAIVRGDGSTMDSTMGIGAGAGLNWVSMKNIASVGTGKIRAGSLEVSAVTREKTPDYSGIADGIETEEDLTAAVRSIVEDYVRSLVTEMGLWGMITGNVGDDMIDPMVDDVTREVLEASGLFDFFGDVDYTAMKKVIHKKADKYVLIIGIPILASVLEFSEFDQPTLERFRTTFVDTFNEEFFGEIDKNIRSIAASTMKGVYHFLLNNTIALLTRNSMNARSLEIMKDEINETAKEFTFKALKNTALDSVKVAWSALKDDVKAYLKEKDTEYKGYADEELDAILNRIDSTGTLSDKIDVDYIVGLLKGDDEEASTETSGGTGTEEPADTLQTLDELLEENSIEIVELFQQDTVQFDDMIDSLTEPDYTQIVEDSVISATEENNIILNDEQLALLRDPSDLRIEAEREAAGGHVIDTQAISGAGSRSIGLAGSAAYTNLNFITRAILTDKTVTETVTETDENGEETEKNVTTLTSGGSVTVAGDLVVIANEKRFVNNVASAALNSRGNASANHSAGEAANMDVGSDEDVQSVAEGGKVRMTVGLGGTAEIPASEQGKDRPKVRITLEKGFALEADEQTGKIYADYSYTDQSGYEAIGKAEVLKDTNGYYIDTGRLTDAGEDAEISIELKPVEVLQDVPVPRVTSPVDVEANAVTVGVKNREVVGNKLSARVGDTVYITVNKAKGRRVETIGYTYVDDQGRTHTVEINPSMTTSRDEAVFTQVVANEDQFTYTFKMPDGKLTDIDVSFVEGDEMDASQSPYYTFTLSKGGGFATNGTGRSIGAGIAFAMLDGSADVEAVIGRRGDAEEGVTAGSITLQATSDREEEVASAAGTDPLSGASTVDDASHLSLDASAALTMLDSTARAVMAQDNHTVTTGYDEDGIANAGDLTVRASESGNSYITASAFNVGLKTAIGATVALNFGKSNAKAMIGAVTVGGAAAIAAESRSRDYTSAVATAVGQDVMRVKKWADVDEDGTTKKNEEMAGYNAENMTATRVNGRLNDDKQENGDDTDNDLPLSMNVLRSQGVTTKNDEAEEESGSAMDDINEGMGIVMGGVAIGYDIYNFFWGSKYQIAASVAMTRADHTADVIVGGDIRAGDGISLTAVNNGNFATLGTAASASILLHSNSISGGAAVTQSYNRANVEAKGDLISERSGDITVSSTLTQNMDPDYADRQTSQSAAGSVSGYGSSLSFGGAVSLVQSKAQSTASIADGVALNVPRIITGGNITVGATDQTRLSGRAGGVSVTLGSSIGVGVSTAVILSENKVSAEIGKYTKITGTSLDLIAEKQAVCEDDYENLLALRDGKNQDLIDVSEEEDDQHYDAKVNLSTNKLLKAYEKVNKYAFQNYYAEALSGSVSMTLDGTSLAGSASVIMPKNTVKAVLGMGSKVNLTAKTQEGETSDGETDDGHMTVRALDDTNTRVIAGSASAALNAFNAGATVGLVVNKDDVTALTGYLSRIKIDGDLSHSAEVNGKTQVFAAAASADLLNFGSNNVISATMSVIVAKQHANNTIDQDFDINAGGSAYIGSGAKQDLLALGANAAVSVGHGGVKGGTVSAIKDSTAASTNVSLGQFTTFSDMNFTSDVSTEMISVVGSAATDFSDGGGIAATLNGIEANSSAKVIIGDVELTSRGGDINAKADSDAWLLNASLSLPGSISGAKGGAINMNWLEREATVEMTGGKVDAAGNVRFQASGEDTSYLAGLVMAGAATDGALEGNVLYQLEKNTIQSVLKEEQDITAGRNAIFESRYTDRTVTAAGSIALGVGDKAVGVTAIFLTKDNNVKTILGKGTVTAIASDKKAITNLAGDDVTGVYIGAVADENHILAGAGVAVSRTAGATANALKDMSTNTVYADASQTTVKSYQEEKEKTFVGGFGLVNFDKWESIINRTGQIWDEELAKRIYSTYAAKGRVGIVWPGDTWWTEIFSEDDLYVDAIVNTTGGDVTVEALNNTEQTLLAGGLNFGMGKGIGPAAILVLNKNDVKALVKSAEANGSVDISAADKTDLVTLNVNAGASPELALEIGFTITDFSSKVEADTLGDLKAATGSISLRAENTADKIVNVAAAVSAAGENAVTPVFTYTGFKGETNAILGSGTISAKKGVSVSASADKNIEQLVAGVAGSGSLALSGAVAVTDIKDHTNALGTYGAVITAESLNIGAHSDYTQRSASAALTGSKTAIGVNGVVSILKSSTLAEMEGRATLEKNATVKASSLRDVIDVGAGMDFGMNAGGMTVMVLIAGDTMDQDAADQLTYGNTNGDKNKAFDTTALVNHLNETGMDVSALDTLEEDLKGNDVRIDTSKLGSKDEDGNVKFDASSGVNGSSTEDEDDGQTDESDDIKNAREVGYRKTIIVERVITVYEVCDYWSRDVLGTFEELSEAEAFADEMASSTSVLIRTAKKTVYEQVAVEEEENGQETGYSAYTESPKDSVTARIGGNAFITAGGVDVKAEQETLADLFAASVNAAGALTGGISFSLAKLRSNVFAASLGNLVIVNDGAVTVEAVSKSGEVTPESGSDEEFRLLAVAKGLKDKLNPTKRSIRTIGLVESLSAEIAAAISAGAARLDNITEATLGGSVMNAGSITVNGEAKYRDVLATTIALAGAKDAAIAASIAAAVAEGTVGAKIIDGTKISDSMERAKASWTEVNVKTDSVIHADTIAAAVAAAFGNKYSTAVVAGLSLAVNNLTQDTTVERGVTFDFNIDTHSSLNINAVSETTANAFLMGADAGVIGVNMGVAIAKVKPTIQTSVGLVGDDGKKTALGALSTLNVTNSATSAAHTDILSATAAGVAVAGNVLLVYNDTDALAKVGAVTGKIKSATVEGVLNAIGASQVTALVVGGVSVGVTVSYVDVNAKNTADVDATDNDLKIGDLYVIAGQPANISDDDYDKAVENGKDKDELYSSRAVAKALAANVGLINIGVNVALARNRVQNNAYITGDSLKAEHVELHSYGTGAAEAEVMGMNEGGVNVATSVIHALNEATSRSYMDLKGAMEGDLNATSDVKGKTKANMFLGGGSIIGVTTNVATARGRTASLTEVNLGAPPTQEHATYNVASTGRDFVHAKIENVIGLNVGASIGVMISRAFSTDVYDAKLNLTGVGEYKLREVNVTTDYKTDVKADTTPSASGVDVNLVGVAVNKATAKNRSYAMATLYTQGDTTVGENGTDDPDRTTTIRVDKDVNVLTTGSVNAQATMHAAKFTWNAALGVAVSKANAAVDGSQAALLKLGKGGIESAQNVNVKSIANKANAEATVGGSGGTDKSIRAAGIDVNSNTATASESFANTAAVMGSISGTHSEQITVDNGSFVTKYETYVDYDTIVDYEDYRVPDGKVLLDFYFDTGIVCNGIGTVYDIYDYKTGVTLYTAYSISERSEMVKYYREFKDANGNLLYEPVWRDREEYYTTEDDGQRYPIRTGYHDVWAPKLETAYQDKNEYDAKKNILKADSLTIFAGIADGKQSGATARTDGDFAIGLVTVGDLNARSSTGESISAMFEGVTATLSGNADVKAQSNAKVQSVGYVPGGAAAGAGVTTEATAGVGTREQTQNATVVIGEYAKLTAANVNLTALNTGYAESHIDCGTTMTLLANVSKSRQPTESWYNTLISVGRGATINATEGNVELLTLDSPTAKSEVKSSGFSVGINYNSMKGENEIHQENNIDIVHEAVITAAKNVYIEAWQTTTGIAKTEYDGKGIVFSSNTVEARNDIERVVRTNIGQDAEISTKSGDVLISAIAGITDASRDILKEHSENITTYAGVKSTGFVGLGNAKAYTNLSGISEITVDSGTSITSNRHLKMTAISSSAASPLTLSEDRMIATPASSSPGIMTTAETKSSGGIPLPNAVAKATLDFDTFININKGNADGIPAQLEYNPRTDTYTYIKSTGIQPVRLTADKGLMTMIASNDWLDVKAEAVTEGKGAAGVSNATGQVDVILTNAIWTDNITFAAGDGFLMYADNGGTRGGTPGQHMYAGQRAKFYVNTSSKLKGVGKASANSRITGTQINQIRTLDEKQVLWSGNPQLHNSPWEHIAADPTASVQLDVKANASVLKILGIKLGKTVKKKVLEWYYYDRCDFCHTGQEWDVNPTVQEDLEVRNKNAYERALIPINDIQREVNRIGAITRAHYGEEEYLAANALYVLDVKSILDRDVRLTQDQTDRYRMWTNTETFQNVYLLPNAAQLYTGMGNMPLYIADILYGDAFGDGQPRFIALYSALTDRAYAKPVISIGSTGQLDFTTGKLLIPSYADVELYLHEVSSAWLKEQFETGFFRTLMANQNELNASAKNEGSPPEGEIVEGLFQGGEVDGWTIIWLGENPDTVEDPDQMLVYLLLNRETDEVDAFRISGRMIENGEDPVDVSLYIYRDSRADRMEEEKYNVFFFDTPEGQLSVVKVMTNTVDGYSMEMPVALEIVLRAFRVKGTDMPAYSLYNCALIMSERNNGVASALDGFYTATYDEDTFDSPYTRVEGISTGEINITLKKDQPIWPEWTGPDTAETVDGKYYHLTEDEWKLEETALMFADANP